MLDTVIKIGQLYREAPDAHKYHEQINHAWKDVETLRKKKDKDGNVIETVFYELPVIDTGDSFYFDFENLREIEDENKQKSYYRLKFKTSSQDTDLKYLFGDIIYASVIKENGQLIEFSENNYKLVKNKGGEQIEYSSFDRCKEVANKVENSIIKRFREQFSKTKDQLHSLLVPNQLTIIHFSFNNKNWFSQEGVLNAIDSIISDELISIAPQKNKYVISKSLYKSLVGGEFGYYGSIPNFNRIKNAHKGRMFSKDEVLNIIYARNAYAHPTINAGEYKVNIMPYHQEITKDLIEDFYRRDTYSISSQIIKEAHLDLELDSDNPFDDIIVPMLDNSFEDKTTFDITFIWLNPTKKRYEDFVEIGTVEQSFIKEIALMIYDKKVKIRALSEKEGVLKHPYNTNILKAFKNILSNKKRGDSLLDTHYLKVLPLIYTDSYYQDSVLLPAFIEQLELKIRDAEKYLKLYEFYTLKYDFYFLMNIQKNNDLMKITETKSYALGKNLGIMAQQFAAWRDDCPIKSFEKSYVGNLSRRITSIEELVKFSGFLNEKLTIHGFMSDKKYLYIKDAYSSLIENIDNFEGEKYNRHNCALGFFESYYGRTNANNE